MVRFYFDFVDPWSHAMQADLEALAAEGTAISWTPLELAPPPGPLVDPTADAWRSRFEGISVTAPFLPWTRKAHELTLHAESHGLGPEMRRRIFHALWAEGRDIGRIDVLVALAEEVGLDRTETKAALDVDRYTERLTAQRVAAAAEGISAPPVLEHTGRRLEGFHNRAAIRTFLHASTDPTTP